MTSNIFPLLRLTSAPACNRIFRYQLRFTPAGVKPSWQRQNGILAMVLAMFDRIYRLACIALNNFLTLTLSSKFWLSFSEVTVIYNLFLSTKDAIHPLKTQSLRPSTKLGQYYAHSSSFIPTPALSNDLG